METFNPDSTHIKGLSVYPVVNYRPRVEDRIKVGHPALICPTNHWATHRVSNIKEVVTSKVQSIGDDGVFYTLNTKYVPLPYGDEE